MPGYIQRALDRFAHPVPSRHEASPHQWNAPTYGSRQQYATRDTSPFLDLQDTKRIQEVLGTFLYYARAVDLTMLTTLGTIGTQQAKPTANTMQAITKLLNYAACNPDAEIRFTASDMILYIESDASIPRRRLPLPQPPQLRPLQAHPANHQWPHFRHL